MSQELDYKQKAEELGRVINEMRQKIDSKADVETIKNYQEGIKEIENELKEIKSSFNRSNLYNAIGQSREEELIAKAKKDFRSWVKKATPNEELEIKNIQATTDGTDANPIDGFTTVQHPVQRAVERVLNDTTGLREVATVMSSSTNEAEVVVSLSNAVAELAGETTTGSSNDVAHEQRLVTVKHYNWECRPKVSQNLIDDAYYDFEAQLGTEIGEAITLIQNEYFVNGTGTNQPLGILGAAPSGSPAVTAIDDYATFAWNEVANYETSSSGTIAADDLVRLPHKINSLYRRNGVFLASRETWELIRTLKDDNKNYLWRQGDGRILTDGQPDTLLGYPAIEVPDMPAPEAGNIALAFGDFRKGYVISDRMGMTMMVDPYSSKPLVEFFTRLRSGGRIKDYKAFVTLQIAS